MICLSCHSTNEEDARFCEQCGQSLHISCPSCGSPATAGALLPALRPASFTVPRSCLCCCGHCHAASPPSLA